ncbi:DUF1540 domain-containing protein [Clostridium sp. BL-8]|uniref:DUF1540 domain-containing protein n=1 Tax=Clostridium sp. BL-8 TaxID=349938 RepID=UPI00098CE8DB|nr:DUF1540 domain-containing protein [Clostridium sp. BL-8]OOM77804.1 hypothetical protein CLOBL_27670 [Clostridium sp. BL-8]
MEKISCDVTNCSHNKSGLCYSNRVDIGGMSASTERGTCCGSFLNEAHYSNLTDNTNSSGQCDSLTCNVQSCTHNYNKLCELSSISVSGYGSQLYSETRCSSFDSKK